MEDTAADRLFDALADPTRRRVVQLLGERPHRAGELARAAGTTAPVMSRHLRTLHQAGFVTDERGAHDARVRIFRLRPDSIVALQAWLDQVQAQWQDQLGAFARHLERSHPRNAEPPLDAEFPLDAESPRNAESRSHRTPRTTDPTDAPIAPDADTPSPEDLR